MARAVVPKSERKTGRRKEPTAAEISGHYTIYVNPKASDAADPEHLQARAFPILERWHGDKKLKDNLLRAVLHYEKDAPPPPQQYTIDPKKLVADITANIRSLLQNLQINQGNNKSTQEILEELSDELEEYGEQFLNFGE